MNDKKSTNLLSLGVVVGALAGATAAYFFAPQKGNKTKVMVAKRLNNLTQTSILRTQNALIHLEEKLEGK